jgi:Protein of unknown function (DUF3348)
MVQASQRTAASSGPALIRLLARLTDVEVAESSQSLSDRLSQWLGWTDAIGLSTALSGNPPVVAPGARAFGSAEESECARVRASLTSTIARETTLSAANRRGSPRERAQAAPTEVVVDYAVFRQQYQSIQQTMDTDIGNLRGRLRAMLAARTPAMARLAVVDAIMERALSPRERNLLAGVPGMLAGHFDRLRLAEQASLADADAAGESAAVKAGTWQNVLRKDMQSVLLAELDVRFQPVEGLLAALRTPLHPATGTLCPSI